MLVPRFWPLGNGFLVLGHASATVLSAVWGYMIYSDILCSEDSEEREQNDILLNSEEEERIFFLLLKIDFFLLYIKTLS